MEITKEFLRNNPNYIFVFGDNTLRKGKAGAAKLRDEPNTYGFITKKFPSNRDNAFFTIESYKPIFQEELFKLEMEIRKSQGVVWLLSACGSGLANKYKIWENIIHPEFERLERTYQNVRLLF